MRYDWHNRDIGKVVESRKLHGNIWTSDSKVAGHDLLKNDKSLEELKKKSVQNSNKKQLFTANRRIIAKKELMKSFDFLVNN